MLLLTECAVLTHPCCTCLCARENTPWSILWLILYQRMLLLNVSLQAPTSGLVGSWRAAVMECV